MAEVFDFIIISDLDGNIHALNPESGNLIWKKKLPLPAGRRGFSFKDGFINIITGFVDKVKSFFGAIFDFDINNKYDSDINIKYLIHQICYFNYTSNI